MYTYIHTYIHTCMRAYIKYTYILLTYLYHLHSLTHTVLLEMGDAEKPDFEMALVNPVILSQSPGKKSGEEGCLSFPMIYGHVERSEWIEVLLYT